MKQRGAKAPEPGGHLDSALRDLRQAAADVGCSIPPTRLAVAGQWAELTARWATRADLTAIAEPSDVVRELMVTAIPALSLVRIGPDSRVLDLGCGSGCTSIAMWCASGCGSWALVDRGEKKVTFCRYALGRCRIEGMEAMASNEWAERGSRCDVVIARALPVPGVRAALDGAAASHGVVLRWTTEPPVAPLARVARVRGRPLWVVAADP